MMVNDLYRLVSGILSWNPPEHCFRDILMIVFQA